MRRLLVYLKPYKAVVGASLFLLLIASVLEVLGPLLTKLAIDKYLAPTPLSQPGLLDPYLSASPLVGLAQIALLYLLVVVGALVTGFFQLYSMQWTGQQAMFDIRREVMTHLQRLDVAFFDQYRWPPGDAVTTDRCAERSLRIGSGDDSRRHPYAQLRVAAMFNLSVGLAAAHRRHAVRAAVRVSPRRPAGAAHPSRSPDRSYLQNT
jgi:ABC-type multidrug transport system fused ATPase/permease subunit